MSPGAQALKRAIDVAASAAGLAALSPLLAAVVAAIWLEDRHSPFYIAPRTGRGGRPFRMVKLRSMVAGADRAGVDSTSASDARITAVGRLVRRFKLDEIPQLWNVLRGDMSLVGPRPNVPRETDLYTEVERRLLELRPGITDLASIVFADEGEILEGSEDPDLEYNRRIRPWKSRLGLLYVERAGPALDLELVATTILALLSRPRALARVGRILERLGAPEELRRVARRDAPLQEAPPPGAEVVVRSRQRRNEEPMADTSGEARVEKESAS